MLTHPNLLSQRKCQKHMDSQTAFEAPVADAVQRLSMHWNVSATHTDSQRALEPPVADSVH